MIELTDVGTRLPVSVPVARVLKVERVRKGGCQVLIDYGDAGPDWHVFADDYAEVIKRLEGVIPSKYPGELLFTVDRDTIVKADAKTADSMRDKVLADSDAAGVLKDPAEPTPTKKPKK